MWYLNNHRPSFKPGLEIIEELLSVDHEIEVETMDITRDIRDDACGFRVTLDHVLNDINLGDDVGKVVDCGSSGFAYFDDPMLKKNALITGIIKWGRGGHWKLGAELVAALQIPSHPSGTEGSMIREPTSWLKSGVSERSKKGSYSMETTLSPSGMVTHVHYDFHSARQLMVHHFGVKLWLTWPPTRWNVEWISKQLNNTSTDKTLLAIRSLSGMKVWVMKDAERAFYLPPYTLHAVLTFDLSGHSGFRFWHEEDFESIKPLVELELDLQRNAVDNNLELDQAVDQLDLIRDELSKWREVGTLVQGQDSSSSSWGEIMEWEKKMSRNLATITDNLKKQQNNVEKALRAAKRKLTAGNGSSSKKSKKR